MRRLAIITVVLALAGCSSKQEPRAQPPQPTSPQPDRPPSDRPQSRGDQCGAHELAYLVGKPKSQIPVPVDPSRRRVACTTCPVTMDFSPARLNIFFDAETGVIKEVKCG